MRRLSHPTVEDIELTAVLYALSDPVRLRIARALAAGAERPCGTIELPVAKATRSYHFRVLRESGVTWMRAEGT